MINKFTLKASMKYAQPHIADLLTRRPLTPLERLTHHAEQVQDQHNEQDRSEDSKPAACSPPGISVIAATAAEQQN